MAGEILLTGGTGTLGRAVVARLAATGGPPRVLSRRAGDGRTVGDLETGAGLDAAVAGVDVIVHAATRPGHDVAAVRQLLQAVERGGGTPHLVYVSIVGVDAVPLPYYREKLAVEEVVAASGLPWTVQRITQFHDLLATIFRYAAMLPVLPVLAGTAFQPIDVRDAAERLARLAAAGPRGRAPDLGGPQSMEMAELAHLWLAGTRRRRRVLPLRVPGRTARGYRAGGHLAPTGAEGRITFAEFVAGR